MPKIIKIERDLTTVSHKLKMVTQLAVVNFKWNDLKLLRK